MFKAEVESFKKHFASGCTLMNQLSMNEAGTICQYLITHATEISTEIVPVGYPVEGREVFLVDDQRQNIGCSGVGEIAVKSRYLSNGYLGDSSLTDKRYYSDPHVPEERIYYTGDFGQILPDGRVIYIGRRDDEVKIRGGKVRASEVQAHLLGHPKVKNAIVLPRKNRIGETQLGRIRGLQTRHAIGRGRTESVFERQVAGIYDPSPLCIFRFSAIHTRRESRPDGVTRSTNE